MAHFKTIRFTAPLFLALCLGAVNTCAQDQSHEPGGGGKPRPAASGVFTVDTGLQEESPALQPDITPLTGVQNPTLGTTELRHNYWVPGIQVASNIQSSGYQSWLADNYVIGNVSLLEAWGHSSFAVNYSGGGHFSTSSQQPGGSYQELSLSQTFQMRRLTVLLLDEFSYLPQSQFGFGGGTNLGVPGGGEPGPGIPGLGNNYLPNQSIYASLGPRYSNAGVLQTTYVLSRRGSITASGSYGILHFINAGNVDNDTTMGTLGYNYTLSREDTIGLVYHFSGYHFPGQPSPGQAFGDHAFNIAYSRKLSGRLALIISGGPELTEFRIPVGGKTRKLGGDVNVNLNYAIQNGGITFGYFHGMSGGSGVFTGSTTDMVNAGLAHGLTRVWSGHVNVGYSRNRTVANLIPTAIPAYDSWFAGGGVSRPIGRNFNFGASYTANIGTIVKPGCTVGSCSSSLTSHYITLSLQWHSRPLILP